MSQVDLEEVISDAVSDAALPEEVSETPEVGTEEASSSESVESSEHVETQSEEVSEQEGQEVQSPAARNAAKPEQDEFEKKFGIPQQGASGRENRIPHSRVQKIVSRAEKAIEDKFAPQLKEWETRWAEQEVKNQKVAQFEEVMVKDPARFVQTLYDNLPQYRDVLAPLFAPQPIQQDQMQAQVQEDGMPGPDLENPDGSRIYSQDGLKGLIDWAISQGETRAVKTLEERYAPIEQSFQDFRQQQEAAYHIQEASQKVLGEMAEARTWPRFKESENEIVQALRANPRLSLEGAYRQVVFPQFTTDRNKMREELLAELKRAPQSTSAPRASAKANAGSSSGPRSLEDVIRESVKGSNLR